MLTYTQKQWYDHTYLEFSKEYLDKWENELRLDHLETLVRHEHPALEEEAIRILAEERMKLEDDLYNYAYLQF